MEPWQPTSGHDHDSDLRPSNSYRLRQEQTVNQTRHLDICDERRNALVYALQGLIAGLCFHHLKSGVGKDFRGDPTNQRLVLDQ